MERWFRNYNHNRTRINPFTPCPSVSLRSTSLSVGLEWLHSGGFALIINAKEKK
jgi:hypothetical protein